MSIDRTVTKAGFKLIIRSGSVTKLLQDKIKIGLKEISENYKKQVLKNISLDDHTLEELRQLGYPYSVDKSENTLHDDRMVHVQSGKFKEGIETSQIEQTTRNTFSVYLISKSPITPYLIYGTSRMRPRRFHEKSFNDIKDKYWEPLIKRLKDVKYRIEISST